MTNPTNTNINNNFNGIESAYTESDYLILSQEEIESSTKREAQNFSPFKLLPTETLWKSSQPFIGFLPEVDLSFSLEELIDCNPLKEAQTLSLSINGEEYSTTFTAQELFSYISSKTEEPGPRIEIVGGFNREAIKRLPCDWIHDLFARQGCKVSKKEIQDALNSFIKRELPDIDFRFYGTKLNADGRFPYPDLVICFLNEKFEGKIAIETIKKRIPFIPVGMEDSFPIESELSSFYICPIGKLDITFVAEGKGLQVERLFSHDRIYTPVLSLEEVPDLTSSHFLESLLFYLTKRLVLNEENQGRLHRTALYAYLSYISKGWIPQNDILKKEVSRLLTNFESFEIGSGIKKSAQKHDNNAALMNYAYAFNLLLDRSAAVDNWESFEVALLFNNLEQKALERATPFKALTENFKGILEAKTSFTPREIKGLFHLATCMLACVSSDRSFPCKISLPRYADTQELRFVQLIWEQEEEEREPPFLLLTWEPERTLDAFQTMLISAKCDEKAAKAIVECLEPFSPSPSYTERNRSELSEDEANFLIECQQTIQGFALSLIAHIDQPACRILFLKLVHQFPQITLDDFAILSEFPKFFNYFSMEENLTLIETINQYCLHNEIDLKIPLKPFQSKKAPMEHLTGMWILSLIQSGSPNIRKRALEIYSQSENLFRPKEKEKISADIIKTLAKFNLAQAFSLYQKYFDSSPPSFENRARLFHTFCNCLKSDRQNQYDDFLTKEIRYLSKNFRTSKNPQNLDNYFWFYNTRNLENDFGIQKSIQKNLLPHAAAVNSENTEISDFISNMIKTCGSKNRFYALIEYLNDPLINLLTCEQKAILMLTLLDYADSAKDPSLIIALKNSFFELKNQLETSDNELIIEKLLKSAIEKAEQAQTLSDFLETSHFTPEEREKLLSLAIAHLKESRKQDLFPLLENKLLALWKKSKNPFIYLDDLYSFADKGSPEFLKILKSGLIADLRITIEEQNFTESLRRINQLNEMSRGTELSEKMHLACSVLIEKLNRDNLQPIYDIFESFEGDRIKELAKSLFDQSRASSRAVLKFLRYSKHDMRQYISREELNSSIDEVMKNQNISIEEKISLLEQFPTLKRLIFVLQDPSEIPNHDFSSIAHHILESPQIWEEGAASDLFSLFNVWGKYSEEAVYNNFLTINPNNWKNFEQRCERILLMLNQVDEAMGIPLWLANGIEFFISELATLSGHKKKKHSLQENFKVIHNSLMNHFRSTRQLTHFRVKIAAFLQSIDLTNEMMELLFSIEARQKLPEGISGEILNILYLYIKNETYDGRLIEHLKQLLNSGDLYKIEACQSVLSLETMDFSTLISSCALAWNIFNNEPEKKEEIFKTYFKFFLNNHCKNSSNLIQIAIPALFTGCLKAPSSREIVLQLFEIDPGSDLFSLAYIPEQFSKGDKDQPEMLTCAILEECYQFIMDEINSPIALHLHDVIYPLLVKALEVIPTSSSLIEFASSCTKALIKKMTLGQTDANEKYLHLFNCFFNDQHLYKVNYKDSDLKKVFKIICQDISFSLSQGNYISHYALGILSSMAEIELEESFSSKISGIIYYLMVISEGEIPQRYLETTNMFTLRNALQAVDILNEGTDCGGEKNALLQYIFQSLLQKDKLSELDISVIFEIGNQCWTINNFQEYPPAKEGLEKISAREQHIWKALFAAGQLLAHIQTVEIQLAHQLCLYNLENNNDDGIAKSLETLTVYLQNCGLIHSSEIFSIFCFKENSLFKSIQKSSLVAIFFESLNKLYSLQYINTIEVLSDYLNFTKKFFFENRTNLPIDIFPVCCTAFTGIFQTFAELVNNNICNENEIHQDDFSKYLDTTFEIIETQNKLIRLFNGINNLFENNKIKYNILYQILINRKLINTLKQQANTNLTQFLCNGLDSRYLQIEKEFFTNLENTLSDDDLFPSDYQSLFEKYCVSIAFLFSYSSAFYEYCNNLLENNHFGESAHDILNPVSNKISCLVKLLLKDLNKNKKHIKNNKMKELIKDIVETNQTTVMIMKILSK